MTDYPIIPPPELVREWATTNGTSYEDLSALCQNIATQSAQWGANQELGACCKWLAEETPEPYINALRFARRPQPLSLKEQALEALESLQHRTTDPNIVEPIRRALEALPE
jgi:hypothetical protein